MGIVNDCGNQIVVNRNVGAPGDAGVVIGDKYSGSEWIPLGFKCMQVLEGLGCILKSIVVKNFEATAGKRQTTELWRYRALAGGFYVFKHEYIFIMQKG